MSIFKSKWCEWSQEEEVDDLVEQWHTMPKSEYEKIGKPELHEYLGIPWEQYRYWAVTGELTANSDESRMEP